MSDSTDLNVRLYDAIQKGISKVEEIIHLNTDVIRSVECSQITRVVIRNKTNRFSFCSIIAHRLDKVETLSTFITALGGGIICGEPCKTQCWPQRVNKDSTQDLLDAKDALIYFLSTPDIEMEISEV